jgi:peptidyl-prolyl cis-trans isomerase A (cyclophilin A)
MLAQTPAPQKAAAPKASPKPAAKMATAPKKTAEPLPARPDGLYVTFDLSHGGKPVGKVVARLYEKESPVTVKNFVDYARGAKPFLDPKLKRKVTRPLYNGLTFHRVIPDFMIQGGDPLGTGMGGLEPIVDENHPSLSFNRAGLLAMANAGPGTGSCQFFITEKATPWLDGRHSIFGEVIEGQDLVSSLARVPRGQMDRPNDPIVMTKVTVVRYPLGQAIWPVAKPAVKSAVKSSAAPAKKAPGAPAAPKK